MVKPLLVLQDLMEIPEEFTGGHHLCVCSLEGLNGGKMNAFGCDDMFIILRALVAHAS